jgi:hypothetical protein
MKLDIDLIVNLKFVAMNYQIGIFRYNKLIFYLYSSEYNLIIYEKYE